MTAKVTYQGALRTRCEHIKSGNSFITDAPIDNNGKGEAFSPTDTLATALASCMFTIMGIKAQQWDLNLSNSYAEVEKIMTDAPRRISLIRIKMVLQGDDIPTSKQVALEKAALTCPVYLSLHPDIHKEIEFCW
ncbi:MAG: OsmC family protein [Flavobacteriaceae bacterium]|nr:OsmC family protein [Flavobacteriaceae bacterium]